MRQPVFCAQGGGLETKRTALAAICVQWLRLKESDALTEHWKQKQGPDFALESGTFVRHAMLTGKNSISVTAACAATEIEGK